MKKKLNKKHQARLDALIQQAQTSLQRGLIPDAIALYQQALQIQPQQAEVLHELAMIAFKTGAHDRALHYMQQAVVAKPNSVAYLTNLAIILDETGNPAAAIDHFHQALALAPNDTDLMNSLALTYINVQDYARAQDILIHAISIAPDHAVLYSKLADVQVNLAAPQQAIEACRTALKLDPGDSKTRSKLLFLLTCFSHSKPEALLAEHRLWDTLHGEAGRQHRFTHPAPEADKRRLRIGYVSGDFRRHAVNSFFEPLLSAHDPEQVEVFCYSASAKTDEVTQRLRSKAAHWCNIAGANDAMVAQKIRQDRIDILIDLSGHTADRRLEVFSYKPAPIQATYLGYGTSTGLTAIDYWITDEALHPADTREQASETIYRLPRCWLSYQPPDPHCDVTPKPIDSELIYTSFCQFNKYRPALFDCWGRILERRPEARLLLKSQLFHLPDIKQRAIDMMRNTRLDPARVILQTGERFDDYLQSYNQTDIALDTFPRSSGTTAADALWMGRPLVTIAGDRYIERLATSKLTAIGHPEWIADNEDEYVDIAVALGADRLKLQQIQAGLRQEFQQSALGDGRDLARTLEEAYRQMWSSYCRQYAKH